MAQMKASSASFKESVSRRTLPEVPISTSTFHVPTPPSFHPVVSVDYINYNADALDPQDELQYLTPATLSSLCDVWFKEYQPWCPILYRPSIQASLATLSAQYDDMPDIVFKAMISLTISHSSGAIAVGYNGRRRIYKRLRSEVLDVAVGERSLQALQALLIISILDYGNDDFRSSWNLLAICRTTCERLIVATQPGYNSDNTSGGLGNATNILTSSPVQSIHVAWIAYTMECATILGARWRLQSPMQLQDLQDDIFQDGIDVSTSFRTAFDLPVTGLRPVQQLLHQRQHQDSVDLDVDTLEASDEAFQVLMSYMDKRYNSSYTLQGDGSITFDTNAVLTTMMASAAVIVLYQQYTTLPEAPNRLTGYPVLAAQRCFGACDQIFHTMSTVADSDMEMISPLLASHLFVAARFLLATAKHSSKQSFRPKSTRFDFIMHALNMCGRRWPLARRYDIVLRAAIVEFDSTTAPAVPPQFWNLQQSAVDIDEVLRQWVKRLAPSVYVGSLNGPYDHQALFLTN
jgi:hypothetical protein